MQEKQPLRDLIINLSSKNNAQLIPMHHSSNMHPSYPYLQGSNRSSQHLETTLTDTLLTLGDLVIGGLEHPCNIAQQTKRQFPLLALFGTNLKTSSVLPFLCCVFRTLNDSIWDTAHGCTMHTETALCHTGLEFVQESNATLSVVDHDCHTLGRDLRV